MKFKTFNEERFLQSSPLVNSYSKDIHSFFKNNNLFDKIIGLNDKLFMGDYSIYCNLYYDEKTEVLPAMLQCYDWNNTCHFRVLSSDLEIVMSRSLLKDGFNKYVILISKADKLIPDNIFDILLDEFNIIFSDNEIIKKFLNTELDKNPTGNCQLFQSNKLSDLYEVGDVTPTLNRYFHNSKNIGYYECTDEEYEKSLEVIRKYNSTENRILNISSTTDDKLWMKIAKNRNIFNYAIRTKLPIIDIVNEAIPISINFATSKIEQNV